MMTCREVNALAHDRIDGRLTRRQRVAVRLHLMMCKHCRRAMRQLEATLALLRATRAAPAPAPANEAALVELFRTRGDGDDDPPAR